METPQGGAVRSAAYTDCKALCPLAYRVQRYFETTLAAAKQALAGEAEGEDSECPICTPRLSCKAEELLRLCDAAAPPLHVLSRLCVCIGLLTVFFPF